MSRQRIPLITELPLVLWLVLVWGALWQDFGLGNLVFGALIAYVIVNFFYLPPVELTGRFNPLLLVPFLGRFLFQLVTASFEVFWLALTKGPTLRNAVVAVQLRSHSDILVTATGHAISLIPRITGAGGGPLHVHAVPPRPERGHRGRRGCHPPGRAGHGGVADPDPREPCGSGSAEGGGEGMTAVIYVVGGILSLAAIMAVYRAVIGPSVLDRVLALDVVLATIGAGLVLNMIVGRHTDNLVLLVVVSLIGFIGSVTVARFVTDRK